MQTLIHRLKEPSSWAGIAALLALAGMNPERADALVTLGVAVAGAAAVFLPETPGGGR